MKSMMRSPAVLATAAVWIAVAHAGSYSDTLSLFKHAGQSGSYFDKSYAYAVNSSSARLSWKNTNSL